MDYRDEQRALDELAECRKRIARMTEDTDPAEVKRWTERQRFLSELIRAKPDTGGHFIP